jgi:signal transduction histidine kinase
MLPSFLRPKKTPEDKSTTESLRRLQNVILNTLDFNQVVKNSVNSVFNELGYLDLGYRIVVLSLINEQEETLERIAISQTEDAKKALLATRVPFSKIIIPLNEADNLCVKAISTKSVYATTYWYDILRPVSNEADAAILQRKVGIKTSMIYPVFANGRAIGSIIFSMVKKYEEVTDREKELLAGFVDLVGLAVQNSSLYTSLQETSEQLKMANTKLKELDKLKDDFVSIASHELRTPMTAIKSYLWMALKRPDVQLTEKMTKYISRAYISTERLINLVNDMLNVSRIEAGRVEIKPVAFDIQALVDDVMGEVSARAVEKSIHLYAAKTPVARIFADPDKVHQVLLNLIGNALKFIPNGGQIGVSYFSDGQTVEVSVKDSGVGISKDDLARLFKKFERLDSSYVATATSGGTGLGLYICKSLIDLMGGKIWANSEGLGKGTTFTFSLPAATPTVLANAAKYTRSVTGEAKTLEPVKI